VFALKALRRLGNANLASRTLIGFANPLVRTRATQREKKKREPSKSVVINLTRRVRTAAA
jgi:hypothetical protein